MQDPKTAHEETPDGLAKRMFVLTMLGVLAYVGAVLTLMSSLD